MQKNLQFINDDHDHQTCIARAVATAENICTQQKQRFTALRRRVFELVWQQHKPIGAYEVLEQLQLSGRAAPPTVYRALDFLLHLGLVHRIASLNAYVGCLHPEQSHQGHFFICTACKAYAEMDAELIHAAIETSARTAGFKVHQHTVEIMGLCPHCQAKEVKQ